MKNLKGIIGVCAMLLAIVAAVATTTKTQAASKELGKRVNYYWIKYDCSPTNPQPVNGPNNFRSGVDLQSPYTLEECPDEASKCAVKFNISNTQTNPAHVNSRLPINPSLELQLVRCAQQ